MKNARRPPPSVPLWGRVGAWVRKDCPRAANAVSPSDSCRGREHLRANRPRRQGALPTWKQSRSFVPLLCSCKERKGATNLRGEKILSLTNLRYKLGNDL